MSKLVQIECQQCKRRLRLSIQRESFGKEIEVTCPSCKAKFRTTIPYPRETHDESFSQAGRHATNDNDLRRLQPLVEKFCAALRKAITTDPHLLEIAEQIRLTGYEVSLTLGAVTNCNKFEGAEAEKIHEPAPLVKDGEVVPEAFTEDDRHWMKDFRINFGED